jgi:hypothetical protein
MQKGEYIISVALAITVVLTILAIQRKWQPASLKDVASSAGEFILSATRVGGDVPDITGYEKVATFRLDSYRAGLYRTSPAPSVFAMGRFVIYDRKNQPVFRLETLEGSREPWTAVYDYAGRHGLSVRGTRSVYTRGLTAGDVPAIIIGQYSGGDHCCTTATVLELGADAVRTLGQIGGMTGLPFEGLELRRVENDPNWEIVGHQAYRTVCGSHEDAADVVSVYEFQDGRYADRTRQNAAYVENLIRLRLDKWVQPKNRSLQLLQTLAADYAVLSRREDARRFFAANLSLFLPDLRKNGIDPNACIEDVENLVDRLASNNRP